jgi:cell division protein FtsL
VPLAASWSGAAVAAPRQEREPAATAHPVARPRRASQRRLRSGIVWIVALAVLLVGVVAVNVAVLRLNMRLDDLDRQRSDLQAQNAALQSQLSSAQASPRIQAKAVLMGLVPAAPQDTSYVELTGR